MSLPSKLTMTCIITPKLGQDQHGDITYGTPVEGVKCFAFGSDSRNRSEQITEYTESFQVLFQSTVDVDDDYKINSIVSHKGELVVAAGVVVNVEKNFHPKRGLVLKQVYIEKR